MNCPKIVVSLTTHSIRVKNVVRTIFSIIRGSFKDIRIVLTLYKGDLSLITSDLQALIDARVIELIVADIDLGPHLKYFYAMQKYRDVPIITIDDDILYPRCLVEQLYNAHRQYPGCIIARRSFYIKSVGDKLCPYHTWMQHFTGRTFTPTHNIFATGIGGILYPKDCLSISYGNIDDILDIKYDDDFYLKALEVRKDLKVVNICPKWEELYLKNLTDSETQSIALWYTRNKKDSDKNILKYEREFLYASR